MFDPGLPDLGTLNLCLWPRPLPGIVYVSALPLIFQLLPADHCLFDSASLSNKYYCTWIHTPLTSLYTWVTTISRHAIDLLWEITSFFLVWRNVNNLENFFPYRNFKCIGKFQDGKDTVELLMSIKREKCMILPVSQMKRINQNAPFPNYLQTTHCKNHLIFLFEFCSHVLWGLKNSAIVCLTLGNIFPNAAVNMQKPVVTQTSMAQSCWRFYSLISVSESLLELQTVSKPCRSTPHESGILEEFLCVQMFLFHCVIILLTKSQVRGVLRVLHIFWWGLSCPTNFTHTHSHTHTHCVSRGVAECCKWICCYVWVTVELNIWFC